MKRFAFVSPAAEREYRDLPKDVLQEFGMSLRALQEDNRPFLPITALKAIGSGVIELKINGSPAYRCVYVAKFEDTVIVLHSFAKTTNSTDKQAMKTLEARYKELMSELRKKR